MRDPAAMLGVTLDVLDTNLSPHTPASPWDPNPWNA